MLWNLIIESLDVTKSSHKMILLFPALYVSFFCVYFIILFYSIFFSCSTWTCEWLDAKSRVTISKPESESGSKWKKLDSSPSHQKLDSSHTALVFTHYLVQPKFLLRFLLWKKHWYSTKSLFLTKLQYCVYFPDEGKFCHCPWQAVCPDVTFQEEGRRGKQTIAKAWVATRRPLSLCCDGDQR